MSVERDNSKRIEVLKHVGSIGLAILLFGGGSFMTIEVNSEIDKAVKEATQGCLDLTLPSRAKCIREQEERVVEQYGISIAIPLGGSLIGFGIGVAEGIDLWRTLRRRQT